jgi:hypothetical protein
LIRSFVFYFSGVPLTAETLESILSRYFPLPNHGRSGSERRSHDSASAVSSHANQHGVIQAAEPSSVVDADNSMQLRDELRK